jgi:hypothetical protein
MLYPMYVMNLGVVEGRYGGRGVKITGDYGQFL